MARGHLKMARKRLAVNGKQVHLAREAKKGPTSGYFWPVKEICQPARKLPAAFHERFETGHLVGRIRSCMGQQHRGKRRTS